MLVHVNAELTSSESVRICIISILNLGQLFIFRTEIKFRSWCLETFFTSGRPGIPSGQLPHKITLVIFLTIGVLRICKGRVLVVWGWFVWLVWGVCVLLSVVWFVVVVLKNLFCPGIGKLKHQLELSKHSGWLCTYGTASVVCLRSHCSVPVQLSCVNVKCVYLFYFEYRNELTLCLCRIIDSTSQSSYRLLEQIVVACFPLQVVPENFS